jgi:hypothetical protein
MKLPVNFCGLFQWKVRRTLAFSIHEMALIEGDEITHRDLLPVFDGFLKDLDEVRIGVLKHLADFLKVPQQCLQCMIPAIHLEKTASLMEKKCNEKKNLMRLMFRFMNKKLITIEKSRNVKNEKMKLLILFAQLLRPDVRLQYLAKVSDFMKTDNNRNWRFRQELAE